MRTLIWFKKDLRIKDNPALFHACQQSEQGVVAIYIIDQEMWQRCHTSHCQIEFILKGLEKLRIDLEKLSIPLIIKTVDHTSDIPNDILQTMHQLQATTLFYNIEYEIYEKNRDENVRKLLVKNQIAVKSYDDQCILSPKFIFQIKPDGFKVFTAYKRQWLREFNQQKVMLLPTPSAGKKIETTSSPLPLKIDKIKSNINHDIWPAGEAAARKRLHNFVDRKLQTYHKERDFPDLNGTSQLSPYLATGMISARECFLAALAANSYELDTGNLGALTWMSELIWREFYRHIVISAPHVSMSKAFKRETDRLPWQYNETLLLAWQEGQTGFPIVDAAMRQLNTTGWMHNRLRMVTAMFLSKNLFLNWRLGERYFAEKLIDNDFASNNGGWQWSASTGTDAVPYFRIFNPTTQSERFDAEGHFIRRFCPELKDLNAKMIHDPHKWKDKITVQYPKPIIDYKLSRERVLAAFKAL